MLSAIVLHTMDLDPYLNASLFEIGMSPDSYGLRCTYLRSLSSSLQVRVLLIHGHCLIDIGLHELILRV